MQANYRNSLQRAATNDIAKAIMSESFSNQWVKDEADERGLWRLGNTGWRIVAMAPLPGDNYSFRVYTPENKWTPSVSLDGAKRYVEIMIRQA